MKIIDFTDAFEKNLATVRSLPHGAEAAADAEVERALRRLYDAAHGRGVATSIGPIPIAPPIDPSLKSRSWPLRTRTDLLALAERRKPLRARGATGLNGLCGKSPKSSLVGYFDQNVFRQKINMNA